VKRICQFVTLALVVVVAVYAVRGTRARRAQDIAVPVVKELGGWVGALPTPFGGTDYYITFEGKILSREDIDKLVVLNDLAKKWNHVTVSLNSVTISVADREYMRQLLTEVRIPSVDSEEESTPKK
jgi:hypothetical protein